MEINKENLLITIITFNPDKNLINLINKVKSFSSNILIIDNNSYDFNVNEILNLFKDLDTKIEIITLKRNKGIAYAMNIGIKRAIEDGKRWFMSFDQDSLPDSDFIENYNYVIRKENNIGTIGISPFFSQNFKYKPHYEENLDQISSGLLINLDYINIFGLYNEKLFIDCVDFEYTLRVNLFKKKTIIINKKILNHKIGNPKSLKLFGIKIESMNHIPFRQYYIYRNHILLTKKYFFKFPIYILKKNYHLMIRFIKTLIIDDDKYQKILMIYKGIKDGFKEKI